MPSSKLDNSEKTAADCLLLLGQGQEQESVRVAPPTLGGPTSSFHRKTDEATNARFAPSSPPLGGHFRQYLNTPNRMIQYPAQLRPGLHQSGKYPGPGYYPNQHPLIHRVGSLPPLTTAASHPGPLPTTLLRRASIGRAVSFPPQTQTKQIEVGKGLTNAACPVSPDSDKTPHVSPEMSPRSILHPSQQRGLHGCPPLIPCAKLVTPPQKEKETVSTPSPVLQAHSAENEGDEITPNTYDVLIGIGRTCSSHPGNRRFHKEIYDQCDDYFNADYKKGVVDQAIRSVHQRGGRFLAKKADKWVVVADHDRLERNTRKSFHQAKKQRKALVERYQEEQNRAMQSSPNSLMHHHRYHAPPQLALPPPSSRLTPLRVGLHVAVYRQSSGTFCVGKIEAQSKGLYLITFEDSRLGPEWINLSQEDYRVL